LKRQCTSATQRTIGHSEFEDVRALVRTEMQTRLFKRSMRLRKGVERLFADAKGKRGLARLRLRGLRGAEEEFLMGAALANLMLLARRGKPAARAVRPASPRNSEMERISGRMARAGPANATSPGACAA
jgi:hypothetical protein